jgi:hypothetical protein
VRDRPEWQEWQEYWPGRNDFNRRYIFALAQYCHETDSWLFGGVYEVIERHQDSYRVAPSSKGSGFIGRLKLRSPYRGRTRRTNLENHYSEFAVQEILREPYTGRQFPGNDDLPLNVHPAAMRASAVLDTAIGAVGATGRCR